MKVRAEGMSAAEVSNLRQLWCNVILLALQDATYLGGSRELIIERDRARTWLTTDSMDLRQVCDMADMNVSRILDKARSMAAKDWPLMTVKRKAPELRVAP